MRPPVNLGIREVYLAWDDVGDIVFFHISPTFADKFLICNKGHRFPVRDTHNKPVLFPLPHIYYVTLGPAWLKMAREAGSIHPTALFPLVERYTEPGFISQDHLQATRCMRVKYPSIFGKFSVRDWPQRHVTLTCQLSFVHAVFSCTALYLSSAVQLQFTNSRLHNGLGDMGAQDKSSFIRQLPATVLSIQGPRSNTTWKFPASENHAPWQWQEERVPLRNSLTCKCWMIRQMQLAQTCQTASKLQWPQYL